jgi:hypothetical protein
MRKLLTTLVGALWASTVLAATVYDAPYGVQNEFEFEIWSTDGLSLDVDETDSGTDVTVRCNDNAEATATNDYTDEGTTYRIVLTAAELQCELVTVTVNEAADAVFYIQTYGDAANARNQSIPGADFGVQNGLAILDANLNVQADVEAIDDDTGAPANEEAFFDGTGYAGTGNTIPTVTTVNGFGNNALNAADIDPDVAPEIMAGIPTGNGPFPQFGIIDLGTAQAADANSITLRSGFSTAAANMVGVGASVYSSTNGLHARCISTAYNNTSKVLTCGGLGEAPTGTVLYALYAIPPGSATSVNVATVESTDATDFFATLDDAALARLPTTLVSGRIDASVGAMANNVITDAASATDFETRLQTEAQEAIDVELEQHSLLDTAFLNCEVDTANFAGSTTTLACDLTDRDGAAVTSNMASGDLTGLEVRILSGAQAREARFINTTVWDGTNNELRITLSRALPATLADAVTAIIR